MDEQPGHMPVVVTGRLLEQTVDDAELVERSEGGIRHGTGHRERQVIEWSDPRLPAVKVSTFDYVEYADESTHATTAVFRGTHVLEGMDGTWTGTSMGVFFADGSIEGHDLLIGRGAYEGLFAALFSRAGTSPTSGGTTTWRGVICIGKPPRRLDGVDLSL